ncbi:MFS transporter [Rhizobium sp. RU36D]|uniref:MFS transporter n=1 Tax=Rhizobium sp. RU36D TaxID=1907415 RepID=UPI0009D806F2|nr:MFS transporter [Rhizobium sp. RU36D]SMC60855.1 MFS transporter, DHA2 family, multidrug resistance protein [Rhizobium sp. RU36D]
MLDTASLSPPLAGRREWIGLAILSIACLIYSMDLSVLFLAMPAIVTDLDPTAAELLWVNDIYGFMVAGFLVTMGTLGDRIGRRKVLLIGAAAFGLASIFAAYSTTASMLILARALLGIAGATIAPSTLSLIVNMFHDEGERNRAIGIWGTGFALGGLIGPLIGGVLLEYFHWGSVFLINVPIMLLLIVLAPFLLPEYRSNESGRLDLASVALSLATVLPVIYGVKKIATEGMSPLYLLPIVCGILFGGLFIRRQKRLADPLVDLALFKIPAFSTSLMINLAGVFFIFGIFLFQNLFLQLVLGLSPLEAALWSAAPGIVFTIMSLQAYRITNRLGPVRTVLLGLIIDAVGMSLMAMAAYAQNLYGILVASMVMGLGFVPVVLTTTGLIVGSSPPERAGAASAISETSAELGGALGVAFLGSLGTLFYRLAMADVDLGGVGGEQADAVRSTLAGAVDTARQIGSTAPLPWLDLARDSFSMGFAVCCALSSMTLILLVLVARRVYGASGEPPTASH